MTCSATKQDTTIHTGDTALLDVNFVDCAGAAVDVTGTTLAYSVYQDPAGDPLFTRLSPTYITIADDGLSATILLSTTNTDRAGKFFHELVATDGDGNVLTLFTGDATFSRRLITCCDPLEARVDTDLFAPGAGYMLVFSRAVNARNFRLFLMR